MKVSICMMVKDEQKNLRRCIESFKSLLDLKLAELIVVDTGSSDATVDIAREYTEKIYFHPWNNDFSDMRNKTISYAKGEWILIIDADEELVNVDELIKIINLKKISSYNTMIFQVRSFNDLNNKDIAAVNPSPRLFKNDGEFKYVGSVHNQPLFKTPIKITNIMLNHYGYILDDKELMEKKFIRTKSILEKELSKNPNNDYYQFQLGVAYDMHGDRKEAYKEFKKAYNMIIDKPYEYRRDRIYIYGSFARSASLNKMYEEVIDICKEGLKLREDFVDLHYILAVTERVVGCYEDSIMSFNTYLHLINNFENLEISKDLTVSFYNIDEVSIESAYFNLFLNYFDTGNYIKAKENIYKLKNLEKKMYCYSNLLAYIGLEGDLFDFYNEVDSNYKTQLSEIIEDKITIINERKQNSIRSIFAKGNDGYAIYNKIILMENLKDTVKANKEILSFANEMNFNNLPDYFSTLIYYIVKNRGDLYQVLYNVSETNLERFLRHCFNKFKNMLRLSEEYISSKELFDENNINHLRISKVLMKNILLQSKNKEEYKELFYQYVNIGGKYIKSIYKDEIIEKEMVYDLKQEDAFLVLVNKAHNVKKDNHKEYIRYLREALFFYNDFSDYIEILNKDLERELDKKEDEFEQYRMQVKNTIKSLIESNKLDDAKSIINQYEQIVPNDLEIILFKSKIALKK
ncbi:glycosyltransferase family 2 protein [Clostridium sp. CX1]|uniref:glycosyltransferase family 2 protein n=1 Tax=Clostridium sp. CX1 TaxID=2978346 RepID=UPI0021BF82AF|nr:glycosyltransferase family 2 protein [Clostridium sp. CX1]MCT8976130.1 glycosyltransferase family 2 protein [Clostridium sp. CX1]